jgi:RNA polymerase-binding transcription factor DksA
VLTVIEKNIGWRIIQMKKNLEEKLLADFPTIYKDMYGDMRTTCMAFGISCGPGWFKLIYDLSEKLEAIAKAQPDDENRLKAEQVKEKFAQLRFYTNTSSPEIEALIQAAEDESATICEQCGAPGTIRNLKGWLRVRCDACLEEVS